MRLAFITNLYPPGSIGGYEEICRDMAEMLRTRGHQVSILTSDHRSEGIPEEEQVYRLLKVNPTLKNRPHPVVEMLNVQTVRRMMRQLAPEAVIIWNGGCLGRRFISVLERSLPVIYYLGDTWLEPALPPVFRRFAAGVSLPMTKQIYRALLRWLYPGLQAIDSNRLIFVSEALKEQYGNYGAEVSRGTVIHNGISAGKFPRRPPNILRRLKEEPARILFVGRLVPEKGVVTLIKALHRLRSTAHLAAAKLTLLGELQDENYGLFLRDLVRRLGLAEAVDFAGHQPRPRLSAIYGQHDVFVFPSEWDEPFGLTLLEAMATGLPVVSSLCGAPAEIIRDGRNALSFCAGDSEELAEKLAWILHHPKEAAAMGVVASEEVGSLFSIEAQCSAFEAQVLAHAKRSMETPGFGP